jgi:sterol desaturase/sphingolipid hydroxylase (fatty acid hydroxylase superfamily)
MEAYPSLTDLLSRSPNPAIAIFLPVFLATTLLEMLVILIREKSYPWKNAGVSVLMAIGHFITQVAAHGVIFGIIAAFIYKVRLTTIAVSFDRWDTLIVLFLLVDLAFYIEHRCSHPVRFLWASHSVHHSSDKMLATTAYRLSWTPILSGVFLFYLPIIWIGFDPVWVYGTVSASLSYQFFVHTELVPRIDWLEWVINTPSAHRVHARQQSRIYRQELWRRAADLGPSVRDLSGRARRRRYPVRSGAWSLRSEQSVCRRL